VTRPRTPISTIVALAVLGLLLGLVGAVVASARTTVGGVVVPWGTVLMLVVLAVVVRAAVWQAGSRAAGMSLVAGWFLATGAALALAPGDDVLLPDSPRTWVYVLGGALLCLLAIAWRLPEGLAELVAAEREPLDGDVLPGVGTGPIPDLPSASPSGDADGVR